MVQPTSLLSWTGVGVTYCDYGQEVLVCKPKGGMFQKAMMEAGVKDKQRCIFVDDSIRIRPYLVSN